MNAASPQLSPSFLTIADVAAKWRTSKDTVRRAISRGELKAVRLPGRQIRIHPRDVERAMKPVTSIGGDAA